MIRNWNKDGWRDAGVLSMALPATNRASLGHRGDKTARKEYTSADSPVSLLTGVPPPRLDDAEAMAHEHLPQQKRQAHRDTEGHGAHAHHGQKTQEKKAPQAQRRPTPTAQTQPAARLQATVQSNRRCHERCQSSACTQALPGFVRELGSPMPGRETRIRTGVAFLD